MDISKEEQKREQFCEILFSLAETTALKEKSDRAKIYKKLEDLYHAPKKEDAYRHFYSDIFMVLSQIQQGNMPGSIDVLGQNLLEIRKGYQSINKDEFGNPINITDSIRKLYDHVSLDIARITYSDAADWRLSQMEALTNVQAQANKIELETNNAEQKISILIEDTERQLIDIDSKINAAQKDYIAILGIFSAVVLSFVGGLAFSTSVLQNIHRASVYRLVFITAIIGVVLFNTMWALMSFLLHFCNGKQLSKCIFIVTNIILVSILIFSVISYINKWGGFEQRITDIVTQTYVEAQDEGVE